MYNRPIKTIGLVPDFVLGPSEQSGIDYYSSSLISCLSSQPGSLRFTLFVSERRLKQLPPLPGEVTTVVVHRLYDHGILSLFWYVFILPRLAKRYHVDYLHLFGGNRRVTRFPRARLIVTVHDIFHLGRPALYSPLAYAWFYLVVCTAIKRLPHVIAVSLATKRDLVSRLGLPPDRISVIHNGHAIESHLPSAGRLLPADADVMRAISVPYILYVSSFDHPRKNHVNLIRAFQRICEQKQTSLGLVFVGPLFSRSNRVIDAIAESELADRIFNLGFVSSTLLRHLYRRALMFVHPSLYEGFGYPLLEAMANGLPIACSDLPVFREIGGDVPVYFDPHDWEAIAAAIASTLEGSNPPGGATEKGVRRARSFTLDRSFEKLVAYYNSLPDVAPIR